MTKKLIIHNADNSKTEVEPMKPWTPDEDDSKLTPEQIKNWRRVLCGMLGPYALIASDEEIQQMRDTFQERINRSR